MNILFISPNSPRESIGGVERYITNLINYYKTQPQYGVILILPTTADSFSEADGNVTVYYDNNLSIPGHASRHQKDIAKKAQLFSKKVEFIIKEHSIDIICAENFMFGPPAIYSLLLNMTASLYKIPLVLRLHMYPASALQIELVNQLMWKRISCVSKSIAGDCFQKGTDINQLSTDYLGVNTLEFNTDEDATYELKKELDLPQDTKIILTAARIIRGNTNILKEKGLINLIQAFSKLAPRYPKIRLLIAVGQASENLKTDFNRAYEMLQGYIKIHNIEKQTIIKMFKLHEMPHIYRACDLFVLPAEINETFGQVFIEAMNCGLPVIGAKSGGIPEIISDSYNGYLVPPDDSSVLAQRIEILINDPLIREDFIKAGIKTVEKKFTSERQFMNFNKMLEETVKMAD